MSGQLLRSTSVVGVMTLLSRLLGFARDIVFATLFGASAGMDAFLVAFKIPNFMRRLFAEGAFAQAFVPVLSEYQSQRDKSEIRLMIDQTAGTLAAILCLIMIVGVAAAPLLIYVFAPGFADQPEKFVLAGDLLRLTFPYLFFISLVALAGGVLNTWRRFAVPAFTPVLLNISLIACALVLAPRFEQPVMALAIGVFIAGIAQLLLQYPFLRRLRLWPRLRWGWRAEPVQRILKLMLPAIFGSSVAQINLLLDTIIASFLVTGSVSWLYYSDRLMEFPLGVFAIALSTVILPSLSRRHAEASTERFSATLDWALRLTGLIATPAAVGLCVLSGPLLTTLFQYNSFGAHDVRMASWSLIAYGASLMGFSLIKVLAPGYFARQDTKTPVKVGVIAVVVNMLASLSLVGLMLSVDFAAPHMGLAAGTGLAAFVNAGLLWWGLQRSGVYRPVAGWGLFLLRIALASLAMAAVLLWLAGDLEQWLAADVAWRARQLGLCVGTGVAVYFGTLLLSGLRIHHLRTAQLPVSGDRA